MANNKKLHPDKDIGDQITRDRKRRWAAEYILEEATATAEAHEAIATQEADKNGANRFTPQPLSEAAVRSQEKDSSCMSPKTENTIGTTTHEVGIATNPAGGVEWWEQ